MRTTARAIEQFFACVSIVFSDLCCTVTISNEGYYQLTISMYLIVHYLISMFVRVTVAEKVPCVKNIFQLFSKYIYASEKTPISSSLVWISSPCHWLWSQTWNPSMISSLSFRIIMESGTNDCLQNNTI